MKTTAYFSSMAEFNFAGQTGFYRGKVRDVYTIFNDLIVLIASDRLSAFDVIRLTLFAILPDLTEFRT